VTVQADEGSYVPPTTQTFNEWADQWTESLCRPGEPTQAAIDDAEIPAVHPKTGTRRNWHSLRHTYARKALQGGASLSWLRGQLGHSSPLVTQLYQHWADEGKRQQAKLLAGVFAF
jgi:hypothetical protein